MNSKSTPKNNDGDPGKNSPLKRLPNPCGWTLHELIYQFQRADSNLGFRVHELTQAMCVAAETLKVSIAQLERLSLTRISSLAELLGIPRAQLVANLFHQVTSRKEGGLVQSSRQARVWA